MEKKKKKKEAIRIIGKKYTERTKNDDLSLEKNFLTPIYIYICVKLINTKKK